MTDTAKPDFAAATARELVIEQRHRDAAIEASDNGFTKGRLYSDHHLMRIAEYDNHPLIRAFANFESDEIDRLTRALEVARAGLERVKLARMALEGGSITECRRMARTALSQIDTIMGER